MRILQVEKYYWPQGGASRYALELSELLEADGHTVVPFASASSRNLPSRYSEYFVPALDFAEVERASLWQKIKYAGHVIYSPDAKKRLTALLQKTKIDVAHLHTIYHQISPSIIPVLRERNIPTVMTLHDYKLLVPNYTFYHHGAIHEEDARGWYLSNVFNKGFKNSVVHSAVVTAEMIVHHKLKKYYEHGVDRFIAPSLFMKNICERFGWPADKIIHLPIPVVVPTKKAPAGGEYVAYVGRLTEEKGLLVLCEAAKLTPEIPYVLVGDGPLRGAIELFIKNNKLRNVELTGFKQGRDLEQYMHRAKLFVLPSVWYENYPLSVLEAKAHGKIVVASAIGGLPEMLPPELLVAPNDAAALAEKITYWFTASEHKRTELGKVLREEVQKNNDPVQHREAVMELYSSLKRR